MNKDRVKQFQLAILFIESNQHSCAMLQEQKDNCRNTRKQHKTVLQSSPQSIGSFEHFHEQSHTGQS